MNINKLKGRMRECQLSQERAAEKMGISLSRFNAKVNCRRDAEFSLGELRALKDLLGLSAQEVEQIFFT